MVDKVRGRYSASKHRKKDNLLYECRVAGDIQCDEF